MVGKSSHIEEQNKNSMNIVCKADRLGIGQLGTPHIQWEGWRGAQKDNNAISASELSSWA